jgi:hypothetical protein
MQQGGLLVSSTDQAFDGLAGEMVADAWHRRAPGRSVPLRV